MKPAEPDDLAVLPDDFAIELNPHWGAYLDAVLQSQQAELSLAMCAAQRADALARLHDEGFTMAAIAEAAGLTPTRVWQLITRARRGRVAPALRPKMVCADCGGALPGCGCDVDDE